MKKYVDTSWDFKNENTKIYTHCFHNYPAMMIPQIASRLIEAYAKKASLLFDPYCGTGTSLVEANLHNINAIGTDLNPLARLISKAKTTCIPLKTLDLYIRDFNDYIFQLGFNNYSCSSALIPEFDNITFWFQKNVIEDLGIIKHYILNIQDLPVQNFFKVAFSETVRETSLTRNGEFKLYRMNDKQIQSFKPDVFSIILSKICRNRKGYAEYCEKIKNGIHSNIFNFNTCDNIPSDILPENSIDLVVTSPPYGDSRTTVAYGQFSRLANQWLDIKDANQIDKQLMGGSKTQKHSFDIKVLDEVVCKIGEADEQRAFDVVSFYKDLESSINNVSKVVKKKAHICYVVGNRKVKGLLIPTDEIINIMFEKNNFKHIETIIRNIPSKRMPSKNSPTNEIGKLDTTMNEEFIVVMKKAS